MNITYVGNFSLDFTTETHIYKSLEKMGHRVTRIQETPEANPGWINNVPADTDLFLFTRTWGNMVTLEDLAILKERGIPTASYHLDLYVGLARSSGIETDPFWRTEYVFSADGDPDSQKFFESKGVNHYYLPPAVFDQECYIAPRNDDIRLQGDVIFVGGGAEYGHPEWPYRHKLVKHLEETYGQRYKKFGHPQLSVRGAELNQLYSNAKIAVGDSVNIGFHHKRYTSDRLFESIGRGAFTIYPYIEGVAEMFPEDLRGIFYQYDDFEELDRLINYYLTHEFEREELRTKLHEFVKASQTYLNRLQELLDTLSGLGAFGEEKRLTAPLTHKLDNDDMIITMDFGESMGDVFGRMLIASNPKAQARWKIWQENPNMFTIAPAYDQDKDGKEQLVGLSVIMKAFEKK